MEMARSFRWNNADDLPYLTWLPGKNGVALGAVKKNKNQLEPTLSLGSSWCAHICSCSSTVSCLLYFKESKRWDIEHSSTLSFSFV